MAIHWISSLNEINLIKEEYGEFDYINIPHTAGDIFLDRLNIKDTRERLDWSKTKWKESDGKYSGIDRSGKIVESEVHIYNHITALQRRNRLSRPANAKTKAQADKIYRKNKTVKERKTLTVLRNPFDRVVNLYYDYLDKWTFTNTSFGP